MTLIWAVILFGLLIFFHELGHFLVAKMVGVKVLKFSLGFGPKLIHHGGDSMRAVIGPRLAVVRQAAGYRQGPGTIGLDA